MTHIEKRLTQLEHRIDSMVSSNLESSLVNESFLSARKQFELTNLIRVIWQGKWWIIFFTLIFSVFGVLYAVTLPNVYRSEALLAPSEENSGGGLAALSQQFGGLASLAGVQLSGSGNKTALALEVLKSREFISRFIEKYDVKVPLVATKSWDREANKLVVDKRLYDEDSGKWVRQVSPPKKPEPSLQEVYELFLDRLKVSQREPTNFVEISVEFYSPYISKFWVDRLVSEINQEIKARDVLEARKSIEYLTLQIEKTPVADMQKVFYELIEEQLKTIMFAEVRDEYVFKTIDEAIVSEKKVRPKRAVICVLAAVLGFLLGVLFVFFVDFLKENKD